MSKPRSKRPTEKPLLKELDDCMTELVAIGASVAGHCQPCLAYHVARARELGLDNNLIEAAMAVGQMVEKGAMSAMRKFVRGAMVAADQSVAPCCADIPKQGGKKGAGNR